MCVHPLCLTDQHAIVYRGKHMYLKTRKLVKHNMAFNTSTYRDWSILQPLQASVI